jgi:ssDNA-binding replication factor A large subunit
MAKKKKKQEEDEWTEDLVEDEAELPEEEIDISKLKFTKIKDLKVGMEDVNIEATIDFVGESRGRGFGEDPFALGFLKDDTGEIKVTFWGEDIKLAKPGKKVRIIRAGIGEFREQLQVYPDKQRGIEFI